MCTLGRFIVLTGLDGSGKDFVAKHLKDADRNAILVRTPAVPFAQFRTVVDEFATALPAVHYFFYLASVIQVSNEIRPMIENGNVYCVRYLLDTVIYHRALGLPVELEYNTPLYSIRPPDLTVFLGIRDETVRKKRVSERGQMTAGDLLVDRDEFRSKLLSEYRRFATNYTIVDNTRRHVDEVVSEIRNLCLDA